MNLTDKHIDELIDYVYDEFQKEFNPDEPASILKGTDMKLPLDDAREELDQKTLKDIQRETAVKWAARAVVAAERGQDADAQEYGTKLLSMLHC